MRPAHGLNMNEQQPPFCVTTAHILQKLETL